MQIDVVIPWVDGNDPVLKEKRHKYASPTDSARDDVGGDTRFADLGEIHLCVESINKFAPFIRKIFILTDGQDPGVKSDIPVEIVDHKVIFRGYEEYLPVFNSTSIETLIYRIPDLSEHYLLMNDDFVITRPVKESDFFLEDGRVVCYSRIFLSSWAKFLGGLSRLRDGYQRSTFKRMLLKGCERSEKRHPFFFYLVHTPRPQLRSIHEEYYAEHPEAIKENIRPRFRSPEQFQEQALFYMLLWERKLCCVVNPSDKLLFVQHWKGPEYIRKKLDWARGTESVKFACFNSLDQAGEEERKMILDWLKALLG